ncbi:MAG: hypothetical protein QOH49_1764 [Acidobacteriota bacterium]|jgi:hypothetical protein|nr:hypothetical protein [Acidobacteriota bacterium]
MREQTAVEIKRRGAAACLFAAPVLMLAGDALRYWAGAQRAWLVMLKLALALFVGAALGVVGLTRGRADGAGLLGGALVVVGCLAGSGIVTANAIFQSFDAAALGEAAERAFEASMMRGGVREYILLYPLPGLAFPAGFLVLAYALWRSRAASPAAALLVALGALLFPVGRIGQIEAAVIGSGLAFTLGMALVALRLFVLGAGELSYSRPTPSASATRLM